MFIALLLITSAAEEIPAIYKSSPYFSNAIGSGTLTVTASAEPTTLTLGDSLVFTIQINNVRNRDAVKIPLLDFKDFIIDQTFTRMYGMGTSVSFCYIMRPRAIDVTEIPSIRLDYYFPEAAEGKRLRTKYTAAIPIVVKAKVEANATPSFTVPERFQTFVEDRGMVPRSPSLLAWISVPLCTGFLVLLWVQVWRFRNPHGARLARLQRHRAVRRAIAGIDRGQPIVAFRHYLHGRFGLSPTLSTPGELSNALRSMGIPLASIAIVEQLLRDGDAARFGGAGEMNLAVRTREAILALEAA